MQLKPRDFEPLPTRPLVSVLIACYNYADYVGAAIESALRQTYTNFEILVCDDGSTDRSAEIAATYAQRDGRVRVIRKENGGQASAFDVAFRASNGRIICLLDADDAFCPEKLEKVVGAFHSHATAGLVAHRLIRSNKAGKHYTPFPLSAPIPAGWHGPRMLSSGGILGDLPPTSGLSLRRELAEVIFPLAAQFKTWTDAAVQRVAPLAAEVSGLDEILAEYRFHGANAWNANSMSVPVIERELAQWDSLWKLQKHYLSGIDSRLSDQLSPLDASFPVLTLKYVRARLQGNGDARTYYRQLCRHSDYQMAPWIRKAFWRCSIALPRPVFQWASNFLVGPSLAKLWVGSLFRRRNGLNGGRKQTIQSSARLP